MRHPVIDFKMEAILCCIYWLDETLISITSLDSTIQNGIFVRFSDMNRETFGDR